MNLTALTPAPLRSGSRSRESLEPPKRIFTPRILLAEDDPILRRLLADVLEDVGLAVDMASDGEQAWEALQHEHYDLLVTDNEMPQLTGIGLIGRIRKEGMSLPVIVASGSFPVEGVRDYPQLQIAAVIPKPFRKSAFLDTVRNVLSVREDPSMGARF